MPYGQDTESSPYPIMKPSEVVKWILSLVLVREPFMIEGEGVKDKQSAPDPKSDKPAKPKH